MMSGRGAQEAYMAQRQNARPQYMQVFQTFHDCVHIC